MMLKITAIVVTLGLWNSVQLSHGDPRVSEDAWFVYLEHHLMAGADITRRYQQMSTYLVMMYKRSQLPVCVPTKGMGYDRVYESLWLR